MNDKIETIGNASLKTGGWSGVLGLLADYADILDKINQYAPTITMAFTGLAVAGGLFFKYLHWRIARRKEDAETMQRIMERAYDE